MKTMKFFIYSILLNLIFSFNISSQTANELDNKNGFKIFILGSSIDNYKEFYKFSQFQDMDGKPMKTDGKQFLNLKNTEYNKIGEIPIQNINLQFNQNVLVSIEVWVNYEYNNDVFNILKDAYGTPNIKPYSSFSDISTAEWAGNVVSLKLKAQANLNNLSGVYLTFSIKETKKTIENKIKKGSKDL